MEYALVLAMIVVAAGFCVELLGLRQKAVFENLSSTLWDQQSEGRSPRAAAGAAEGSLVAGSARIGGGASTRTAAPIDGMTMLRIGAAGLLLLTLGFVWQALRSHRRRKPLCDDLDIEEELTAESRNKLFVKRQDIFRTLTANLRSLFDGDVRVRHVMTQGTTHVPPDLPLPSVLSLMHDHRVHHLMVTDKNGKLLGVISDRDFSQRTGKTAADVMTRQPLTIAPDAQLGPVITLMLGKRISCLPVVEEGRLLGVASTTDLLMALQCSFQIMQHLADQLTQELGPETVSKLLRTGQYGTRIGDVTGSPDALAGAR